ncbi:YigZ family protein [uncultured Dokdonia sp.]|uniref:IMPACT family protein n=1 Tax=uncultured Dokdonia sp. TaxID=575653 RepID=UPI0026106998|nr:YigZ family protein [uncultured Dokdonia sp.]
MKDTYKTITTPSPEALFKDRNSKFYGYAFPVENEDQIKECIETLKKQHHQARHWCYAWVLGKEYNRYRANDDGEPSNSAGAPIYGQLQAYELTNTLVVVVRYFGGTKLGVGGLINAYRTAAQLTLEKAAIQEKTIDIELTITFEYALMNKVMRVIKEQNIRIIGQKSELACEYTLAIRKKDFEQKSILVKNIYGVKVKEKED